MSRRFRLLFAGSTFVTGGAERVLQHLILGIDRARFDPELLALREPGAVGEEIGARGVPLHARLTGGGKLDPFLIPRLHELLVRGRFDALYVLDHAHAVFHGALAALGSPVRAMVMPVHTTGQWGGRPSIRRPVRMVLPRLDRVIAIAEAQRRYLIEEEGIPAGKLCVIPNGIPIEAPDREERMRRRRAARALVGAPEDREVIGITAVLRPEKNHELLLKVMARIHAMRPRAELWIVGDGPRRAALEARARPLGAAVRFLGHRPDARVVAAGFDVAVLASHPRVETLPLSLLEAMDAGLPVVATRVGALAEMIEEGRSGYLVSAGDAAAFADALLRLLDDPSLRAALGERGAEITRERYSVERMCRATEDLLLSLLAR